MGGGRIAQKIFWTLIYAKHIIWLKPKPPPPTHPPPPQQYHLVTALGVVSILFKPIAPTLYDSHTEG